MRVAGYSGCGTAAVSNQEVIDRREVPHDATYLFFIAVAICSSILLTGSATLSRMFVYDRSQILAGQFWRLVTGHLVHFSTSHLLLNLGGFVSLLSVLYRFKMRVSMLRLVLASGLMSLGLLVFAPNISTYGGLSALVTGLAVVFIMQIAQTKHRAVALFLLLLLTGKVLRDFLYPGAQFIQYSTATHTAPLAHVLGAVGAMAMVSRAFPN